MTNPLDEGVSPAPSAVDSVIHQPPSPANKTESDILESTNSESNSIWAHCKLADQARRVCEAITYIYQSDQSVARHCEDYKDAIETVSAVVLNEPVKPQDLFNFVLEGLVEDVSSAQIVVKLQQMVYWSTNLPSAIENLNMLHSTIEEDLERMYDSSIKDKRDIAVEKYTGWLRSSGAKVMAAGNAVLNLTQVSI